MAIVRNGVRVSSLYGDFCRCEASDESSASLELVGGSFSSDVDSGMASDDVDLTEIGEYGTELCQVDDQSFPFSQDLYDLPNLGSVLSLETWNECLTEDERFALAEYLPDMDQETFALTLIELLSGNNFQFGSPLAHLFNQLKTGFYDPTVVLYRRGLNIFRRIQYYHHLSEYQNSMVRNLVRKRNAVEDGLQIRKSSGTCSDNSDSAFALRKVKAKGILKAIRGSGYSMAGQGSLHGTAIRKPNSSKFKRKDSVKRFGEEDANEYAWRSHLHGSEKVSDQAGTTASYDFAALNRQIKAKQSEKKRNYSAKECFEHKQNKIPQFHCFDSKVTGRHGKVHEETHTFNDSNIRGKKCKAKNDSRTSKSRFVSYPLERAHSDYKLNNLSSELRRKLSHLEGAVLKCSRKNPSFDQSEDTHSDSSGKVGEGRDMHSYASKSEYFTEALKGHQSGIKLYHGGKLSSRQSRSSIKVSHLPDGGGIGDQTLEVGSYYPKVNKKGKTNDTSYPDDSISTRKKEVSHFREKLQPALLGSCANSKREVSNDLHHSSQATDLCNHVRGITSKAEVPFDLNMKRLNNKSENRSQIFSDCSLEDGNHDRSGTPIQGCNFQPKMRKVNSGDAYLARLDEPIHRQSSQKREIEGSSYNKKKKRKGNAGIDVLNSSVVVSESTILETGGSDLKKGTQIYKEPFTLITPTIHTGFSFSIIHLLSAVRKVLITAQLEDAEDICNLFKKDGISMLAKGGEQGKLFHMANGTSMPQPLVHVDGNIVGQDGDPNNLPYLRIQEIVHRVMSNPGDPCILETSERLPDLVRGVLKIFSSKTAPLGAKGWRPLVLYEKSIKSWHWVAPVSSNSSDNEEETSAEAWGIPHKVLVKLVDAFANWLKSSQETLQQIGTLPMPPTMVPVMDYKDRFRDLRAQKSLNTINPSSEEVRAYFHKEELLRYSIPDRAFQYTAYDGKKSVVAPLRRGGGKPTSKARDHYMLKPDRPPHVTVLCLVRDAAARLPGSIGTRADVCTLIRDSQFIVEDVTDAQVNQVVSGALDRLHYERDPCVQFQGERKLWVYLHGDREEEDFEDDGTSSTKKWKRQRKDAAEPFEIETANDSNYLVMGEPTAGSSACEFNTNLNIDSSNASMDEKGEMLCSDSRPKSYVKSAHCIRESKMLCQHNSTNQDFDAETFSRERPVGLLSK